MKKRFLLVSLVLLSVCYTYSQETFVRSAVSSSVPNSVRHEIVQTGFRSGFITLRLDKFTGRVFYLTMCPQRNVIGTALCWKETTVLELPKPSTESSVQFQIFGQGEANRFVLLINNVTGQTWQLGLEDGIHKWTPLVDTVVLPQSYEVVK